jgi:uncharacterized protein (TIRG00374 family)
MHPGGGDCHAAGDGPVAGDSPSQCDARLADDCLLAGDASLTGTPLGDVRWARRLTPAYAAVIILATVIVAGGIVLGRHTLAASITALTRLNWAWFVLAAGCEVISLVTFGMSRRRLLCADGHRAGFGSVMAVTYASNALSMTIPFAGAQLAVVFSYRQFRRRGLGSAISGWALAVSAIMSAAALALILLAGAIAGGIATAAGLAGAAVFLVPATAVLLALRDRQVRGNLDRILARIITLSHRLFRWPPEGAASALEDVLDRVARIRLTWPRYTEVFVSVLNWTADCGCLAATIRATGGPVPWHGLLLAYAAGAAVGSTGLTPGGFALVEATLTAALVASGLTASTALASVLAYRLISFWMIMIVGWILMIALTRARTGQTRLYTQVGRGSCGSRARRHSRAGRAAQRSRSLAPGIQVVLLLCSESVDFGIQRGEREPGDPGVNCRRYAVHPGG